MSIASRSPPTSPPVGFRTETTAARSSSARGASTWSGSEYRHRPRTVAPPRRSRASESAPSRPTRAGSGSAACGRQEEVVADPGEHRIDALTRFEVREHDGAPAALLAGVALHDGEVGADVGREVDLVDDEQLRARDARPALARDFLALGNVDHVEGRVHELGAEGRGQVIAAALEQQELEVREILQEEVHRLEVYRRVFTNRGVRAPAGLDADDALGRQGTAPDEELRILLRVDVVGDHGHVELVAEPQAERLGQRGLARADGAADADLHRARDVGRCAHDRNRRMSSVAWRIPASSRPGLKLHISSTAPRSSPRNRSSPRAEAARSVWRPIWRLAARNSGTHFIASSFSSSDTTPAISPHAASRVAQATATASHGPAPPSRWATRKASRPAASPTRPSCTYVSRPNEWAKPPAGKRPSASWRSARNAESAIMAVAHADGVEHRLDALEGDAEPGQELVHRRVVGHQQPLAIDREREVAVADLEGDADRLGARARRDGKHGLARRLGHHIPPRADVKDVAGVEDAARGERQREGPARARDDAAAPPTPLLGSEHERVALQMRQINAIRVGVRVCDHRDRRYLGPHQKRKYRCAIGRTRAGSHVSRSPSARTT